MKMQSDNEDKPLSLSECKMLRGEAALCMLGKPFFDYCIHALNSEKQLEREIRLVDIPGLF